MPSLKNLNVSQTCHVHIDFHVMSMSFPSRFNFMSMSLVIPPNSRALASNRSTAGQATDLILHDEGLQPCPVWMFGYLWMNGYFGQGSIFYLNVTSAGGYLWMFGCGAMAMLDILGNPSWDSSMIFAGSPVWEMRDSGSRS